MLRSILTIAAVALLLCSPSRLLAGGPPWLCLPLDGVTSDNAAQCSELLTSKLKDKLWAHGAKQIVHVKQHEQQWYATFSLGQDVALSDVQKALQGTKFSVPHNKLRLFGHVILEFDPQQASLKTLIPALERIDFVSVEASTEKDDRVVVTLDMPYPQGDNGLREQSVGWAKYGRDDLSFDQAARSVEKPIGPEQLPALNTLRDVIARQGASLTDVRWSDHYACRPLGGVAASDSATAKAKPAAAKAKAAAVR